MFNKVTINRSRDGRYDMKIIIKESIKDKHPCIQYDVIFLGAVLIALFSENSIADWQTKGVRYGGMIAT